ncbi:MAG: DUF5985 family protein [Byssovorax sp.]
MAAAVYILSALISLVCSVLLLRSYAGSKVRLLLWGGVCFLCLAGQNVFLFVDYILLPEIDLAVPRELTALLGVSLLLYSLIWDTQE